MSLLQAAVQPAEINPANLAILFQRELELCQVKGGETIALVSDLGTRREYIQSAFAAADALHADVYEMCVNSIPGWTKVGVPTIGKCKGTLGRPVAGRSDRHLSRAAVRPLAQDGHGQEGARTDDHRRTG